MELYTLHTKQDYTDWMYRILEPIRTHYTEGCARVVDLADTGTTYEKDTQGLEAFSRMLWGLIPFWMGGGSDEDFKQKCLQGIANGTNPSHEEYWGSFRDYDQKFVEMAAIAFGIMAVKDTLWEPLDKEAQNNLASWLNGINHYVIPDCNWQFFRILVNIALKKRGMPYDAKHLKEGLDKIEDYYLGDGWYQDGASCQKDYYIAFGMHYYGLLYSILMCDEEPERSSIFKERAKIFARDFIHWFANDGAALPYGRSLTYRFGQAAFWSAYVYAGIEDIPLGVVKGILSRHLQWWGKQKMTEGRGILAVGYSYPNLRMAERYNAASGCYWGLKTMLCLALPDEHPFWEVEAAPLPIEDGIYAIKQADMLMQYRQGDVVAYPAGICEKNGHGNVPEKYAKFVYSTRFGFCCATSQLAIHENCPDSMLAFVINDYVFVRKVSTDYTIYEDRLETVWSPFEGIQVKTTLYPLETGHRREHEVVSAYDCIAYDCGFAVQKFGNEYREYTSEQQAFVGNTMGMCQIEGIEGGEGVLVGANPNTNILYQNTEIPAIRYMISKGVNQLKTLITTYPSTRK